MVTNLTCYIAT